MKLRNVLVPALALSCWLALPSPSDATEWRVPEQFATIQAALDSPIVVAGDRIVVAAGAHAGAVVRKSVEITGEDGATITTGPRHPSGMLQGFRLEDGASGTTISHLRFTVDLAIMNAAGRTGGPGAR